MTADYKELCERLQEFANEDLDEGWNTYRAKAHLEAKAMIEAQAKQIAELLQSHADAENRSSIAEESRAKLIEQGLRGQKRIAELERKHKEAFDDCGELNTENHELLAACTEKDRRIAELKSQLEREHNRLDWLMQRVCCDEISGISIDLGLAIDEHVREFRRQIDAAISANKGERG